MPRTYIRRPGDRRRQEKPRSAKIYVPRWIDPFPWIQGSVPEKMVMAEFVRRGIYFEHTPQTNALPWDPWMFIDQNPKNWEADFLLPQYKIWIEVQGSYFHTLPGQIETDSLRFAFIESVGWRPIFWWDYDIESRLQDLMNEVPEFYRINRVFEQQTQDARRNTTDLPFYEGGDGIDHLAGLRTALRNRGRPPQLMPQKYRKKRKPK